MATDRFKHLAQQFDVLAENLALCSVAPQRAELLKRMRIVIDEIDRLLLQEHSYLKSEQESTAPQNSL
jgi:hypothetical protein